jgi:hypothetical protein
MASVAKLQDEWRRQLRDHSNPRTDAAAWDVINVLPAHLIITIPVGVAATNRSRPAISNALAELEAAGVMVRITSSPRNLAWEARGVLDLIEELESGTWIPASVSGYTDDEGRLWPFYSQSALRVGSRAVVELASTDTIDVGDNMPTIVPGLSEVVVRKVPTGHGTNFNLVVRVPTEEGFGDRKTVLARARDRGGLPETYTI